MTDKKYKFKISGLILLILSVFTSSSLFFFSQDNNNLSVENSEELKVSGTYWTTTEVVSTESTYHSKIPKIAVDGVGNVHVVWYEFTDYGGSGIDSDVFYKRWNAISSTWTITEVVSTESGRHSDHPTIAVDGVGNVHVAWEDVSNYYGRDGKDVFYKRWNATSSTWTTTEVVSTESTEYSYFTTIAVDSAGNVHVAWEDLTDYDGSGEDSDIFYKRWNVINNTWTATEVVSTESIDNSQNPMIAVDGVGNVHMVWQDFTNYSGSGMDRDVFYKRWNATNSTWTMTEVVSTESTDNSRVPAIALDGTGNAHVVWEDLTNYGGSGTDSDIFYKQWNTTSSTWTTTEVVSTESTDNSWVPSIALDGTGNAHVAWEDVTNYGSSGTDSDIFYRRWNVISNTWTAIEVISTESTSESWFPTIAVDSAEYVHVAWVDSTYYGGAGTGNNIFYKRTKSDLNPPSSFISFIPYRGTNEVSRSTTFILTAGDGLGSGVSVIKYRINNSAWIDYTGPFDLSSYAYGYYIISYHAIDLVNNIETDHTCLVILVELQSQPSIQGYNIFLLMGITYVVSVILIKRRNKNK